MSREVRRVPANWEHPKDANGSYIPHHARFPYDEEGIKEGLEDGELKDEPPNYGCDVMPQWPESERTHYQMYESVTEGTPLSPVMESPEALACWLAENNTTACGDATATYDQWLAMIKAGSSVASMVIDHREFISGVEAVSEKRSK